MIKKNLSFKQIRGEIYRLKTMRNTTEFHIGTDFTKKEVDKLIESGQYNISISGPS